MASCGPLTIRATTPAHRPHQPMPGEQLAVARRGILRSAVRVADASARRPARRDGGLECGHGQSRVDGTSDCVADHAAGPRIEDQRDIDETRRYGDVGDVAERGTGPSHRVVEAKRLSSSAARSAVLAVLSAVGGSLRRNVRATSDSPVRAWPTVLSRCSRSSSVISAGL